MVEASVKRHASAKTWQTSGDEPVLSHSVPQSGTRNGGTGSRTIGGRAGLHKRSVLQRNAALAICLSSSLRNCIAFRSTMAKGLRTGCAAPLPGLGTPHSVQSFTPNNLQSDKFSTVIFGIFGVDPSLILLDAFDLRWMAFGRRAPISALFTGSIQSRFGSFLEHGPFEFCEGPRPSYSDWGQCWCMPQVYTWPTARQSHR